jgi:thiol peroxidase
LEVKLNDKIITLQKKDRKIGSEAPAIRVEMINGETKVIGMMADKVQVMIFLPFENSLSQKLLNIIDKYKEKSLIYAICSKELDKSVDSSFLINDFKNISLKMGVYVNDTLCAKSIFIINKDGEIVYKETLKDLSSEFNIELFDSELNSAIEFKKKGHTHENWMGA